MIRNENGMLTGYVFVDIADVDIGSYVAQAKKAVAAQLQLPAG
jgi:Cu(I)/Ag(I) efflux system membrane protein CusA/SilA